MHTSFQSKNLGGRISRGLKLMVHSESHTPFHVLVYYLLTYSPILGPVFSFRVPNRQFIVLNSLKSATELLDRRSSAYSDRPKIWMTSELAKRSLSIFNIYSNHPYFKVYRTMLKSGLSPRTIQDYQILQTEECRVLLNGLYTNPEQFTAHIRR
jgi:cytochrome P450